MIIVILLNSSLVGLITAANANHELNICPNPGYALFILNWLIITLILNIFTTFWSFSQWLKHINKRNRFRKQFTGVQLKQVLVMLILSIATTGILLMVDTIKIQLTMFGQ